MSQEFFLWFITIVATAVALHYGSAAGHQEHPAMVEAEKRAVKIVTFTLIAFAAMTRLLVLYGR